MPGIVSGLKEKPCTETAVSSNAKKERNIQRRIP